MLEFWKDLERECGILDKKVRCCNLIFGYFQTMLAHLSPLSVHFTLMFHTICCVQFIRFRLVNYFDCNYVI